MHAYTRFDFELKIVINKADTIEIKNSVTVAKYKNLYIDNLVFVDFNSDSITSVELSLVSLKYLSKPDSNSYEAYEQTKAELKAKHTKQVATKGNLNLK